MLNATVITYGSGTRARKDMHARTSEKRRNEAAMTDSSAPALTSSAPALQTAATSAPALV